MSKQLPAKAEANNFQGPVPEDEQAEADAEFGAALKQAAGRPGSHPGSVLARGADYRMFWRLFWPTRYLSARRQPAASASAAAQNQRLP